MGAPIAGTSGQRCFGIHHMRQASRRVSTSHTFTNSSGVSSFGGIRPRIAGRPAAKAPLRLRRLPQAHVVVLGLTAHQPAGDSGSHNRPGRDPPPILPSNTCRSCSGKSVGGLLLLFERYATGSRRSITPQNSVGVDRVTGSHVVAKSHKGVYRID
jgi:hypothetical protein